MKNTRMAFTSLAVLAIAFLLVTGTAFAHHGTAAYNTTKSVTVTGTITEFDFFNPHVLVFMNVNQDGKGVKWQGELTSPNHLARSGWHKDTLKVGQEITMSGFPAKDGAPSIWIQKSFKLTARCSTQEAGTRLRLVS
ncbi:MAG: DUF6152 family protein [Candidatus Acidiferrales bacterium]